MTAPILLTILLSVPQGTPADTDAELGRLVRMLGSKSFRQREQATRRLANQAVVG